MAWGPGSGFRDDADQVGEALAALAGGLACIIGGHRTTHRRERFGWYILGVGVLAWGVGQVLYFSYDLRGMAVPYPGPPDVGFLLFPPLALFCLLGMVKTPASRASRFRGLLEGLIIAGSTALISWILVLSWIHPPGSAWSLGNVVAISYPVSDLVLLTVVIFSLVHSDEGQPRSPVLLAAGVSAVAMADTIFTHLTQNGSAGGQGAHFMDLGWVIGFLLIGCAGLAPTGFRPGRTLNLRRRRLLTTVPFIPLSTALVFVLDIAFRHGHLAGFELWDLGIVIALVITHQVSLVFENLGLTTALEARVAARTAALEEKERYFRALVEGSSDAMAVLDQTLTIVDLSPSAGVVLAIDPTTAVGSSFLDLCATLADRESLQAAVARATARPRQSCQVEWTMTDASGQLRTVATTVRSFLDEPAVNGLVLNTADVTAKRELDEELRRQAFTDALTGIPNRALFLDRARVATERSRRSGTTVGVLFIDLDGFKTVNDSVGHQAGDRLLEETARRLMGQIRPGDTVARMGGDEFAVLLEDLDGPADAIEVAERLLITASQSVEVGAQTLRVGASVGVATAASGTATVEDLLRNADTAMYAAKAAGKGRVAVFEEQMHTNALRRLIIEAELANVIAENQLMLVYQPTVSLATSRISGCEALVRWIHPVAGPISPISFIPIAEETGIIVELGRWVLNEACRQLAEWTADVPGGSKLSMAVNVSARQLADPDLVDDVRRALQTTGLDPARLVLEITESVLVVDSSETLSVLGQLKALGVQLAIDDFGTGYASLSYLQRLPIDILKIDKSFVDGVAGAAQDGGKLIRGILEIGRALGLRTVAEGIESLDQLEFLRRGGCDVGQGYYFARPSQPDQVAELVRAEAQSAALGEPRPVRAG